MRIMWKLFAYQHTKMKRHHALATENRCTYCSEMCETQDHVIECKSEIATKLRETAQEKIQEILLENIPEHDSGMKSWLAEFGGKIWDGSIADMPQSRYLERLEENADLDQITNSIWSGYISSPLITLVANATGSRKSATKIVKAMNKIATDLHFQLWEEKNKIQKNNRKKYGNPEWTINDRIKAYMRQN